MDNEELQGTGHEATSWTDDVKTVNIRYCAIKLARWCALAKTTPTQLCTIKIGQAL